MIGQDVEPEHRPAPVRLDGAEPVLELREIQLQPKHAPAILDHVSFTVHAGEIFGIAGVSGNGQDELCDLIAGSRTASAGQILLDGTDITNASIRARIEAGLGYVPVDRYRDGMVMDMTLAENMFLKSSFSARWARHGVINRKALEAFTAEQIQEHRVKAGARAILQGAYPAAINRRSCWPERSISAAVFWFSTSRHEGWIWARSTGSTRSFCRSARAGKPF